MSMPWTNDVVYAVKADSKYNILWHGHIKIKKKLVSEHFSTMHVHGFRGSKHPLHRRIAKVMPSTVTHWNLLFPMCKKHYGLPPDDDFVWGFFTP